MKSSLLILTLTLLFANPSAFASAPACSGVFRRSASLDLRPLPTVHVPTNEAAIALVDQMTSLSELRNQNIVFATWDVARTFAKKVKEESGTVGLAPNKKFLNNDPKLTRMDRDGINLLETFADYTPRESKWPAELKESFDPRTGMQAFMTSRFLSVLTSDVLRGVLQKSFGPRAIQLDGFTIWKGIAAGESPFAKYAYQSYTHAEVAEFSRLRPYLLFRENGQVEFRARGVQEEMMRRYLDSIEGQPMRTYRGESLADQLLFDFLLAYAKNDHSQMQALRAQILRLANGENPFGPEKIHFSSRFHKPAELHAATTMTQFAEQVFQARFPAPTEKVRTVSNGFLFTAPERTIPNEFAYDRSTGKLKEGLTVTEYEIISPRTEVNIQHGTFQNVMLGNDRWGVEMVFAFSDLQSSLPLLREIRRVP